MKDKHLSHKDLKSKYLGLIFNCPYGQELENCPLIPLRKLDIDKRVQCWESLTREELIKILEHHKQCLLNREQ